MPLTVDIIPKMSIYERTNPYMEGKCMGFTRQKVWVMGYWRLWVMGCISPRTNLVDGKTYGLSQVMGYLKYGLWQVRLYIKGLHTVTGLVSRLFRVCNHRHPAVDVSSNRRPWCILIATTWLLYLS